MLQKVTLSDSRRNYPQCSVITCQTFLEYCLPAKTLGFKSVDYSCRYVILIHVRKIIIVVFPSIWLSS